MNMLVNAIKHFCFFLLMLLVILMATNVVMRYVVNEPLAWTEEAGILILVWLTFMSAVIAAAEKKHMGMDLFLTKLVGEKNLVVPAIISVITIVSLSIVTYYGMDITWYNLNLESESLQISYAYFYLAIPVGCLLFVIVEIHQLINLIRLKAIKEEK